jgi:hypothetical protein
MAQKKQSEKQFEKRMAKQQKLFKSDMAKAYRKLKKSEIKMDKAIKSMGKPTKSDMERMKKFYGDIDRTKLAKFKKVPKKSLAKRLVGKTLAKAIPGAGAAVIAHDVMRAGSKKGCIERGGEWVGSGVKGRCKVAKKTKKTGGPDPRFAKSRRTKSKK